MGSEPPKKSLKKVDCGSDYSPLEDSELDELDAFCAAFDCEDISFDSWVEVNNCLNLQIEKTIDPSIANQPGKLKIEYTRRIQTEKETKKLKDTVEVTWEKIEGKCQTFSFCGRGDSCEEAEGDLIVTLKVIS